MTNNFECIFQKDNICNSVIRKECQGVLCRHYNNCDWCKIKDCTNCKNKRQENTYSIRR